MIDDGHTIAVHLDNGDKVCYHGRDSVKREYRDGWIHVTCDSCPAYVIHLPGVQVALMPGYVAKEKESQ